MKLDMAGTGAQRKKPFALLREICAEGDWKCLLSAFIWGAGCFCYRQWIKGAIYLLLEAAFILFFVFFGGEALYARRAGSESVVWHRRRQFDHHAYLGNFCDHHDRGGGHGGVGKRKEHVLCSMQSQKGRKARNIQADACEFAG